MSRRSATVGALVVVAVFAAIAGTSGCTRRVAQRQPPAQTEASASAEPTAAPSAESSTNPSTKPSGEPTLEPKPAPKADSRKVLPPESGAYAGAFHPPAPFDISSLKDYRKVAGKRPAILMWFQAWDKDTSNEFDGALVVSTLQQGAIPMITWEPWNSGPDANYVKNPANQRAYQLKDINAGKYDSYMRSWARGIRKVGSPIMLRPMHEMNGQWYPWCGTVNGNSPEEFIKAWRRMHDIFEKEGATNVTWVWSINCLSVPDSANNKFDLYYPGDDYVDWTSISGFNWGTSRSTSVWMSFDEIYSRPLAYLRHVGKPIVLSEFGSVPNGGDKAAWITDAYTRIENEHPEIDAVLYYDKLEKGLKQAQAWQVTSSKKSERAYREAIADPYYLAGPTDGLSAWADNLSTRQWQRLRSIPPLY